MKTSLISSFGIAAAVLTALLAAGCASQRVKCDRHLVPINVAHGTRGISK